MKQFLIIFAITGYLFSCTEDKVEVNSFATCNNVIATDSLSLATSLIGAWTWTERYCPCCVGAKPTLADKAVTTTFNSDLTFSVSENSTIINTGTWEVEKNLNGYIVNISELGTGPYLEGSISVCENRLFTDMTPLDGCKYLFIKKK